jgi:hypothetical protein
MFLSEYFEKKNASLFAQFLAVLEADFGEFIQTREIYTQLTGNKNPPKKAARQISSMIKYSKLQLPALGYAIEGRTRHGYRLVKLEETK